MDAVIASIGQERQLALRGLPRFEPALPARLFTHAFIPPEILDTGRAAAARQPYLSLPFLPALGLAGVEQRIRKRAVTQHADVDFLRVFRIPPGYAERFSRFEAAAPQEVGAAIRRYEFQFDPASRILALDGIGGDPNLAWSLLERVAENAPPGFTPYGFWYHRHRRWFGNQRLVDMLSRWTGEYAVFWERHGPPDGCTWNGEELNCAWAD